MQSDKTKRHVLNSLSLEEKKLYSKVNELIRRLMTLNNIDLDRKIINDYFLGKWAPGICSIRFLRFHHLVLKVRLIIYDSVGCNVNNKNII